MLQSKIVRTGLVTEPLDSDSARFVELVRETGTEILRHPGRALAIGTWFYHGRRWRL